MGKTNGDSGRKSILSPGVLATLGLTLTLGFLRFLVPLLSDQAKELLFQERRVPIWILLSILIILLWAFAIPLYYHWIYRKCFEWHTIRKRCERPPNHIYFYYDPALKLYYCIQCSENQNRKITAKENDTSIFCKCGNETFKQKN